MIERLCRKCHKKFTAYNSLDRKCPECRTGFKQPTKPMNQKGKVAKQWDKDRAKWLRESNNGSDTWKCVVGGKLLSNNKTLLNQFPNILPIQVDHNISRTRDPSKRNDQTNLGGMCGFHNTDKGSRSLQEYLDSKPDMQCRNA